MMVSSVHYSSPCKDVFLIQVKEYVVQVVTEALGWSSEPGSRFIAPCRHCSLVRLLALFHPHTEKTSVRP